MQLIYIFHCHQSINHSLITGKDPFKRFTDMDYDSMIGESFEYANSVLTVRNVEINFAERDLW